MIEYIKFHIAKTVAEMTILFSVVAIIVVVFFIAVLVSIIRDKIRRKS